LKIKRINRIISFHETAWMKPYIDLNTKLRTKAKNDFEKKFLKLMNISVFAKTMENIRKRVNVKFNKASSNQFKQRKFNVATKVLRNTSNAAKKLRIIKNPNIFHTRSETLAFTFIRCMRQLVAQELDHNKIHVLSARNFFRRRISKVGVLERSCY